MYCEGVTQFELPVTHQMKEDFKEEENRFGDIQVRYINDTFSHHYIRSQENTQRLFLSLDFFLSYTVYYTYIAPEPSRSSIITKISMPE